MKPFRVLRIAGLVTFALMGLLAIVLLARVAGNWGGDLPPAPPSWQQVRKPGSPMFFHLQGLLAPATESPEAAGRQAWQQRLDRGYERPASADTGSIAVIGGGPLACSGSDDCVQLLLASPAAVREQLAPVDLLGRRCNQELDAPTYDEPVPARLSVTSSLPDTRGLVQCVLWFNGQSLAAAANGEREPALRWLRDGRRLIDAVLTGGKSGVTMSHGVSLARRHFDALNAVALLQPGWVPELQSLLVPLPPRSLDPRAWIAHEAAASRGALEESIAGCGRTDGGWLAYLACHIVLRPKADLQAHDQVWMTWWTASEPGMQAAVDHALSRRAEASRSMWSRWVEIGNYGQLQAGIWEAALPATFARALDLQWHRQTLALALQAMAAKVAPADRPAWLDRQDLPAHQRARMTFSKDATALEVRPWSAEFDRAGPGSQPYRVRVAAP